MLGHTPEGVELSELRSRYRELYGRRLILSRYGLRGLEQLLVLLGDRVHVERVRDKNVLKRTSDSHPGGFCDLREESKTNRVVRTILDRMSFLLLASIGELMSVFLFTAVKMEKARCDVIDLLKLHPEGIPFKNLPIEFKQKYNRELQVSKLGFSSLPLFLYTMREQLYLKNDVVFLNSYQTSDPVKMEKARCDVIDLLKLHPKGIPINNLPIEFKRKYGRKLKVSKLGFSSVLAFLHVMSDKLCLKNDVVFLKSNQTSDPTQGAPNPKDRATPPSAEAGASNMAGGYTVSARPPVAQGPLLQLPLVAVPVGLSHSDFPVLGSNPPKTQGAPRKADSTVVFRDAFHSRLREEHSAHVRATEEVEELCKERKRGRVPNVEEVNSRAEELIRAIAAEGELVTVDKVVSRLCKYYQVQSLRPINPIWQLPAVMDLHRTVREVDMFIKSAEAVQSICTLYEMGQALAGLKNKKRFEELNLGPLCRIPLIRRIFQVDATTRDDDIVTIETVDILKVSDVPRRSKSKIDLVEFLKHLADQYNCDSPYKLGIRIQGLGLPISTLTKARSSEYLMMDRAKVTLQREIEEEVADKMRKMKKSILDPAQASVPFSSVGSLELRKKYVSQTAAEAVLMVFTNAEGVFSAKMTKYVQDFLLRVSSDRLTTALFQLAICCGSLEVPQDLVAKEKSCKSCKSCTGIKQGQEESTILPPSEGMLSAVKLYFQESFSSLRGVLSLALLSRQEKKLVDHFKFREFTQLKQGTFLEFLVKHAQVLQEAGGSIIHLGSQDYSSCGFRPSQQDVYEFIKQCGVEDQDRIPCIEHALRSHYKLRDSRDLGYGQLSTQVDMVRRQKGLSDHVRESPVRYESPLFIRDFRGGVMEAVGLLGAVTREQALSSLVSAPLLEDLAEWSQWELVFQPQLGPLKDFMESNSGTNLIKTELAALETKPGVLLRISTSTGDMLFSEAAEALDPVGTAGHLVSIVVADGIANAPVALLANHMESSLATAVTREDDGTNSSKTVAKFILDCILRIPTRICKALLTQVFLEPLSRVLGQAKSKAVLLQTAKADWRHLNRLHHVGILLGMTDWVKDFHSKLSPPQSKIIPPLVKKLRRMSTKSCFFQMIIPKDAAAFALKMPSLLNGHAEDDEDSEEKFELVTGRDEKMYASCEDVSDAPQDVGIEGSAEDGQSREDLSQVDGQLSRRRVIIENIRKNEFGIGVELNEEGEQLMKVHQERLGRSLDRLSAELYSKDTHFVLELIQNADDNSYSSNVQPALAFVIEKDCIVILNNENGFEEQNIRAICDVGRSTKGKHKYGYIGQKGIGFKSVFKVTDCPEIHSNDFHLRFEKNSGPMGYILPHWVEEEKVVDTNMKELKNWNTKIFLPLRSKSYQTRNLFHDVDPSLLLFLHRLRSITIINQGEGHVVSMTRRDLSHMVSEVQHSDGVERWLVVKRMLFPNKIKEDVESTELALAFRLNEDSSPDGKFQPEKQPVFAFLPLRSFGFRFIIQGDFDIPSSREDVDRDSGWNQWLRSQIPQLFLHAMDVFTEHPEFSGLQGLCRFLQFVPLPDEILDFFSPVASQIIQLLKGKACLPTTEHGEVEFKLPSQIAATQDPLIQEAIGEDMLQRHLNLSYMHPTLQSVLPQSLISALGVHRLRGQDVATVTRAMTTELFRSTGTWSDANLKEVAKLLVCNFRALEQDYGEAGTILEVLRDIPFIPLADGRVVSLREEGVFFPLMDPKNTDIEALYKDLSTISPQLLDCLDPLGNSLVVELLKRLNVHQLEPQKVLQEHIYPLLKSGAWKMKQEDIIISYVVFIKQHSQNQDYRTLDEFIPVLTNKGFLCARKAKVQFSKEYGNIDLPTKLPGVDWILLDTCYLQADKDPGGWKEFFSSLGVRDLLIFNKEQLSMSSQDLSATPWAKEADLCHLSGGMFIIEDYQCAEFHSLVTADHLPDQVKLQQRHELLNLLEKNWDTGYDSLSVLDNGQQLRETHSSFCYYLTQLPWVPAFRQLPGRHDKPSVNYLRPNSVYLNSDEVNGLLGIHVNYIHHMRPSEFTRYIGMKHCVSLDELISHLKTWCTKTVDGDSGELEGAWFTTTVEHVYNVYSYLLENLYGSKLKTLFQETPAVFVECEREDEWSSGRFYLLKDLCWNDPTGMFRRYKECIRESEQEVQEPRVLAPFYTNMTGILGVEPNPSMKQYVDLLQVICSSFLPNADVLQDISVIFAKLADKCKKSQSEEQENDVQLDSNYCSSLREMLKDKKVFPTKSTSWMTLARNPLIPDDKTLEKVFRSYSNVCLLNLPPPNKPKTRSAQEKQVTFSDQDRALFLNICKVKKLSECITTEPQTENYRPCPALQTEVRRLVPYIQRYLFHHEENAYCELQDGGIAQLIKALSFGQVGKLYIQYQLSIPNEEPIFEKEDAICLLKDKKELYIQKDHLSTKLDICRELVKLFSTESSNGKELQDFLEGLISNLVFCKQDEGDLKRFLQRWDIKELPGSEEKWEVPQPLEIKPEPLAPSIVEEQRKVEQTDGEDTLACWPPKASLHKNPGSHTDLWNALLLALTRSCPVSRNTSTDKPPEHGGAGSRVFQGNGAIERGPMALDTPVWSNPLPPESVLEDLVLDCSRPNTVEFPEDKSDNREIGEWGELLVNAFLTHWKESGSPSGPKDIMWYNREGEGGQPFDFKVTFSTEDSGLHEVFVEVKSTVKSEKHFIRLSANELDLALKEKERYHIYRVYNAGDSQNVRLCRIKNLAQHLHSKELELFLFV
uniref:Wu:fj29h11 n=1 Tax=Paramormyrops kingsleyae TaxID=1676925 RepID=A0A3B3RWP0_9TELE